MIKSSAISFYKALGFTPHDFQVECWEKASVGMNGLLMAPTGSGKTYALGLPMLLKADPKQKRLQGIWITPLRALSHEIYAALEQANQTLCLGLDIALRNGDTSPKERQKQQRQSPHILVTTPESLHLLLASKGYPKYLGALTMTVIDEWHDLMGSKRGVLIELALSKLKFLNQELMIWGISATLKHPKQAIDVLAGNAHIQNEWTLIKAQWEKNIEIHSVLPETMERFPWRGHLGIHLIEQVIPLIEAHKTVLIFTNTRSQCEIWYQKILETAPEYAGQIAMHHSSIDKSTRLWVEQAIKNESLKAVVCTSSLDLGVDFAPVEAIIQIGGPKGIARFMQRAGRSGHQPGAKSIVYFVPTHAIELVEAAALRRAIAEQLIENATPYLLCYDVLIQYCCTLAVSEGYHPHQVFEEVQSTHCFHSMTIDEWKWIQNFLEFGSKSLASYDEYKKVTRCDDQRMVIENRGVAMRHRLQIGTIVSDASLQVVFQNGGHIGTVEEWFASQLKAGDLFTFAGRTLEFIRLKELKVIVRRSSAKPTKVPSWMGGRLSFTSEMSWLLKSSLQQALDPDTIEDPELQALRPIFERQTKESYLPKTDEFLVEVFQTREGHHHVFYPFEGRFVHEAMASLLAYRISLLGPLSCTLAYNDYGFEILSDQPIAIENIWDNNLWDTKHLNEDLYQSINITEMSRRTFRDIAVISQLVFSGYPTKAVKTKHLQGSSQLLYEVFKSHEPDNLLYLQSLRETLENKLEEGRLQQALKRIKKAKVLVAHCETPTPFSFPIITDRLREKLSNESLAERIRKMTEKLERT
ncbi:MAG: ligase-associated DNA damage response DEXH box helicase [Flavobacteriaceae bacterium]